MDPERLDFVILDFFSSFDLLCFFSLFFFLEESFLFSSFDSFSFFFKILVPHFLQYGNCEIPIAFF